MQMRCSLKGRGWPEGVGWEGGGGDAKEIGRFCALLLERARVIFSQEKQKQPSRVHGTLGWWKQTRAARFPDKWSMCWTRTLTHHHGTTCSGGSWQAAVPVVGCNFVENVSNNPHIFVALLCIFLKNNISRTAKGKKNLLFQDGTAPFLAAVCSMSLHWSKFCSSILRRRGEPTKDATYFSIEKIWNNPPVPEKGRITTEYFFFAPPGTLNGQDDQNRVTAFLLGLENSIKTGRLEHTKTVPWASYSFLEPFSSGFQDRAVPRRRFSAVAPGQTCQCSR